MTRKPTRQSTLFDLVRAVQDHTQSDEEAVAVIAHLLATGRVRIGTAASR
jgi:hypothetical protein